MVKFHDSISNELQDWVSSSQPFLFDLYTILTSSKALQQSVFFTASAPLAGRHINISPKGLPSTTLTVFSPNHVAYIDATGSGCETVSHIYENGRVTIMFCSFETSPRIMRWFCKGRVVEWDAKEFEPLLKRMGKQRIDGARAIIDLDVFKCQTSCGYGVPFLASPPIPADDFSPPESAVTPVLRDRETLGHWASKPIDKSELHNYQARWNADSLDGLPGLRVARRDRGERLWVTGLQARGRWIMGQREGLAWGFVAGVLVVWMERVLVVRVLVEVMSR